MEGLTSLVRRAFQRPEVADAGTPDQPALAGTPGADAGPPPHGELVRVVRTALDEHFRDRKHLAPDVAGAISESATRTVHDPGDRRAAQVEMFALLVLAMVTSGVFVGHWLSLSRGGPSTGSEPGQAGQVLWVLGVVGVIFALALVTSRLAPAWLRRRHRWIPLSAQDHPAVVEAFADAARTAGLLHLPQPLPRPRWRRPSTPVATSLRPWTGSRASARLCAAPPTISVPRPARG
jgi:hypothetical protein